MYITKTKLASKYFKLCFIMALVLLLNANNSAFSEEEPLTTIGEPQLNKIKSEVTPYEEKATPSDEVSKPDLNTSSSDKKFVPDKEISSPFSITNPVTTTVTKSAPSSASKPTPTDASVPTDTTYRITPNQIKAERATPKIEDMKGDPNANVPSLLTDPKNQLGLAHPYNLLDQSLTLLKKKDVAGAKVIVEPLSEWLTTLTEYHIQLFKKLNDIDTAKNQAQVEKKLALDMALLRDKAYYQLGLIYLAENKQKEALKYLIEVIKSQPKTELGMKAYEILQQLGFTEKVRLYP